MSESLKGKTAKGVLWSSVERFSTQGVQFVIMIVMARLLTPKDYGLIGMLAIFLAVSQSLIDSGFSQALIRKQHRTETDNSTVFYFNLAVGVILYLLLFLSAPWVADFYDTPELTAVMRVVCLGVIINSLAVVQRALLTVNIDFKTQAKASFSAALISGCTGIVLAYSGHGVWALVVQQLLNLGINTGLLWLFSSWRPKRLYSWQSFHELFAFGSKLLASGLLGTLYNNVYTIVIGKLFSAGNLGHYTRAQHFAEFPSSNLTGIMQRVTYPVLCSIQDDDKRLEKVYRKFLKLSAFVVFPLMLGLSAVARPFIRVAIGEQWEYCAILLQIICFSMMWYPIHAINLTAPFGLVCMCYGQIFNSIVALVINTYYTGKLIHIGFLKQMRDLLPTLLLSLSMFALVLFVNRFIDAALWKLVAGTLAGALYYVSFSILFRFSELKEIFSIIQKK